MGLRNLLEEDTGTHVIFWKKTSQKETNPLLVKAYEEKYSRRKYGQKPTIQFDLEPNHCPPPNFYGYYNFFSFPPPQAWIVNFTRKLHKINQVLSSLFFFYREEMIVTE